MLGFAMLYYTILYYATLYTIFIKNTHNIRYTIRYYTTLFFADYNILYDTMQNDSIPYYTTLYCTLLIRTQLRMRLLTLEGNGLKSAMANAMASEGNRLGWQWLQRK